MLNRIINNEGSGTGEWTLLSRIIWLKATVLAAAGAAWHTLTGAIVQFVTERAHALKQVVVDINPVQDLHGYANPWPPGGGKNVIPLDYNFTSGTTKQGVTATINADGSIRLVSAGTGTSTAFFDLNKQATPNIVLPAGTYSASGTASGKAQLGVKNAATNVNLPTPFTLTEDTGIYVYLSCASNTAYDVTIYPQIEAGETSTAWSPYENECPFSGWTGAEVELAGKNLFDSSVILNATGWSVENGVYTGNSQELDYHNFGYFLPGLFPTDQQVVFSFDMKCEGASRPGYFWIAYSDGTRSYIEVPKEYTGHRQLVSTAGKTIISLYFGYSNSAIFSLSNIQVEFGSAETAFEAFVGDSRQISWQDEAGTVYRGTVTVKQDGSVDLTATDKKATITRATSKTWGTTLAGKGMFTVNFIDANIDGIPSEQLLSNLFSAASVRGGMGDVDYQMVTYSSPADTKWIKFVGPWADLAAANDWLDTVTLEVLYPLATPITYTLTAQQVISALQGYNAMWADTGDITVTFRGTPIVEPDEQPLQALNLLLGGAYRNNQTPDDVSDEEALDILLGGADR